MLSCREITELATAYAEGVLPLRTHLRFWMHLSMCKHCRRYLRQLRLTVRTLGGAAQPVEPPSAETREALLRQFRNWKK